MNVPYSDEFRDRGANDALLTELAAVQPKDGPPGQLIENSAEPDALGKLLEFNTFRHDLPKATSSQEAWHWLVLMASCVFLGDVFIRRVNVNFAWLPPLLVRLRDFVLRRQSAPAAPQYIEPEEPQGGSGGAFGATPRGDAVRAARPGINRGQAAR